MFSRKKWHVFVFVPVYFDKENVIVNKWHVFVFVAVFFIKIENRLSVFVFVPWKLNQADIYLISIWCNMYSVVFVENKNVNENKSRVFVFAENPREHIFVSISRNMFSVFIFEI